MKLTLGYFMLNINFHMFFKKVLLKIIQVNVGFQRTFNKSRFEVLFGFQTLKKLGKKAEVGMRYDNLSLNSAFDFFCIQ